MPQYLYLDKWKEVCQNEEDQCGDAQRQAMVYQFAVVTVKHAAAFTAARLRTVFDWNLFVHGMAFVADDKFIECRFAFNFHGYNYSQRR